MSFLYLPLLTSIALRQGNTHEHKLDISDHAKYLGATTEEMLVNTQSLTVYILNILKDILSVFLSMIYHLTFHLYLY